MTKFSFFYEYSPFTILCSHFPKKFSIYLCVYHKSSFFNAYPPFIYVFIINPPSFLGKSSIYYFVLHFYKKSSIYFCVYHKSSFFLRKSSLFSFFSEKFSDFFVFLFSKKHFFILEINIQSLKIISKKMIFQLIL